MGTFTIEALEDGVDIAAMVWRPVTKKVNGPQGSFLGSASDYVFRTERLVLDTGEDMDKIAHLGRVNRESNPPMPQNVNDTAIIAGVLRVTKTSDDEPSF